MLSTFFRNPTISLRALRCISTSLLQRNSAESYIPDYYTVLGVSRGSEIKDIKVAYFRMAKKYHPDSNNTDHARFMFQLVAEAYEVLTDEEKRKMYDEHGSFSTVGGKSSGPLRQFGNQSRTADELFNKIFGESAHPDFMGNTEEFNRPSKMGYTRCHEHIATISFEDACKGVEIDVAYNLTTICEVCEGTRSMRGYQGNICPYCEGTGVETEKIGYAMARKPCTYCDGTKIFLKYKCSECEGTGVTLEWTGIWVKIPPGSEDGQLIKVTIPDAVMDFACPDQGNHFFVKVKIEPSTYFKRDGVDLTSEADISVSQALLGGILKIRGLHKKELPIALSEGGISSHKTLVAAGEGIIRSDKPFNGDHFVSIGIKVPKELTDRQLEIMKKFSQLEGPPENGLVNNGLDTPDDHKYWIRLSKASNISRTFASENFSEKQELIKRKKKEKSKMSWFS